MRKTILIFSLVLAGCAGSPTSNQKISTKGATKTPGVLAVEAKQKAREQQKQDQKDKNLVLAQKAKLGVYSMGSGSSVKAPGISVSARPQQKKAVVKPVSAKDVKLSERDLYAELMSAYDRNNQMMFSRYYQMFMAKYSKGVLADDAVYLSALLKLSNRNYGGALADFNKITKQYRGSNKMVPALFGKAMALKKMNLEDQAADVLAKLMKNYPGSPEALRAQVELKLIKK